MPIKKAARDAQYSQKEAHHHVLLLSICPLHEAQIQGINPLQLQPSPEKSAAQRRAV